MDLSGVSEENRRRFKEFATQFAELLVETRAEMVFVSIDGPQPVHDEVRGQDGAFRRTV